MTTLLLSLTSMEESGGDGLFGATLTSVARGRATDEIPGTQLNMTGNATLHTLLSSDALQNSCALVC